MFMLVVFGCVLCTLFLIKIKPYPPSPRGKRLKDKYHLLHKSNNSNLSDEEKEKRMKELKELEKSRPLPVGDVLHGKNRIGIGNSSDRLPKVLEWVKLQVFGSED